MGIQNSIVSFDIADFHRQLEIPTAGRNSVLRLTNNCGLTRMPAVTRIPICFSKVIFDDSCACITSLPSNTLNGCHCVSTLDLSGLRGVTTIGDWFLNGCFGLTNLDLSPLSGVTSIGDFFLYGCSGLTSLDLSPLKGITSIGDLFLYGCGGVTSLDLSPLSGVASIGDLFLGECTSLTNLDLSPLSGISRISNSFLYGCTGLTNLDLKPLSSVISIGDYFLSECSGLTNLDLSPLSVRYVGKDFLEGCGNEDFKVFLLESQDELHNRLTNESHRFSLTLGSEPMPTLGEAGIVRLGSDVMSNGRAHTAIGSVEECYPKTSAGGVACVNAQASIENESTVGLEAVEVGRTSFGEAPNDEEGGSTAPEQHQQSSTTTDLNVGVNSFGGFMSSSVEPAKENDRASAHEPQHDAAPPNHDDDLPQPVMKSILGAGGEGVVYLATDPDSGREIAVKSLTQKASSGSRRRLEEEFGCLKCNEHPNLVTVYKFGATPAPYYTMEYMSGGPINDIFCNRGVVWEILREVILQTLRGLQHLHSCGIRHRDLKPHNILHRWNEDGSLCVKISDFGHSKQSIYRSESEQRSSNMYGTESFRPPETRDGVYSRRSDVYSWALSIAYIVTHQLPRPHDGRNAPYSKREFVALERKGLPEDAADMLLQCMSYRKDDRPRVGQLLGFFESYQEQLHR